MHAAVCGVSEPENDSDATGAAAAGAEDPAADDPGAERLCLGSPALRCLAAMAVLGHCCSPGPALWALLVAQEKESSASQQQQAQRVFSSRSLEEEEEKDPFCRDRWVDKYMSWPLLNRKAACRVVEDLANELLRVCQMLSNNDFMSQLQTSVWLGSFQEGVGPRGEEQFVYRLLVPLDHPLGTPSTWS